MFTASCLTISSSFFCCYVIFTVIETVESIFIAVGTI